LLLVAGCWLLVAGYRLLVAGYWLLGAYRWSGKIPGLKSGVTDVSEGNSWLNITLSLFTLSHYLIGTLAHYLIGTLAHYLIGTLSH
jgi:hypothetical protein